jgi:hypothetical protein
MIVTHVPEEELRFVRPADWSKPVFLEMKKMVHAFVPIGQRSKEAGSLVQFVARYAFVRGFRGVIRAGSQLVRNSTLSKVEKASLAFQVI